MAIKINQTDIFKATNIHPATKEYPFGSVKDEVTPASSEDGTPVAAILANNVLGFFDAILKEGKIDRNNLPETALHSDVLNAMKALFMSVMEDGGNWSSVAGKSLDIKYQKTFWIFENETYYINPSFNSYPVTAPTSPADMPTIFYKTVFITRPEYEAFQKSNASDLADLNMNKYNKTGGTLRGSVKIMPSSYQQLVLRLVMDYNKYIDINKHPDEDKFVVNFVTTGKVVNTFNILANGVVTFDQAPVLGDVINNDNRFITQGQLLYKFPSVGEVITYPVDVTVPAMKNFKPANGQILEQADYPDLYSVYGHTFDYLSNKNDVVNEATQFRLPDYSDNSKQPNTWRLGKSFQYGKFYRNPAVKFKNTNSFYLNNKHYRVIQYLVPAGSNFSLYTRFYEDGIQLSGSYAKNSNGDTEYMAEEKFKDFCFYYFDNNFYSAYAYNANVNHHGRVVINMFDPNNRYVQKYVAFQRNDSSDPDTGQIEGIGVCDKYGYTPFKHEIRYFPLRETGNHLLNDWFVKDNSATFYTLSASVLNGKGYVFVKVYISMLRKFFIRVYVDGVSLNEIEIPSKVANIKSCPIDNDNAMIFYSAQDRSLSKVFVYSVSKNTITELDITKYSATGSLINTSRALNGSYDTNQKKLNFTFLAIDTDNADRGWQHDIDFRNLNKVEYIRVQ